MANFRYVANFRFLTLLPFHMLGQILPCYGYKQLQTAIELPWYNMVVGTHMFVAVSVKQIPLPFQNNHGGLEKITGFETLTMILMFFN